MKIIIIGGSIGGLIAGIALSEKGFDVEIYEKSATDMKDRGAGLVIQPDMMEYLIEQRISPKEVFGVPALLRQVLDENGHAVLSYQNDTSFTSWNYIWRQLKDYFPADRYFFGYELETVVQNETSVVARFKNGETRTADLLVGADGYSSVVRQHFLPGIHPVYAGYVAYRGLIRESDIPREEIEFFANKFSIFPYEHSHLLCYMVPGINGELEEGKRLYNWVWYVNKTKADLDRVLTDKNGKQREFSVPAGFLSDSSFEALNKLADEQLPQILSNRVHQTAHPFVQVITDMAVPRMHQGRVVILGDAAFVVRPHTASGTAKAYRDAIALADSLYYHYNNMPAALSFWDGQQTGYAIALARHGKQLAFRSQLGFIEGL